MLSIYIPYNECVQLAAYKTYIYVLLDARTRKTFIYMKVLKLCFSNIVFARARLRTEYNTHTHIPHKCA